MLRCALPATGLQVVSEPTPAHDQRELAPAFRRLMVQEAQKAIASPNAVGKSVSSVFGMIGLMLIAKVESILRMVADKSAEVAADRVIQLSAVPDKATESYLLND